MADKTLTTKSRAVTLLVLIVLVACFNVFVLDPVAEQPSAQPRWEDRSSLFESSKTSTTRSDVDDYDYDKIYNSFGTHESYMDRRIVNFNTFDNYTSPAVRKKGCRLTVSIVDPRPPSSGRNHPIWFALESVASYVPYACVVFHTSSCNLNIIVEKTNNNIHCSPTTKQRTNLVAQSIYDRSLPLFRRMMERGLVRINILDSCNKYSTKSCSDFGNGNSIFLNVQFWLDEFINGIDSDMILTVQHDSVLCQKLDIDLWKHFAYVGSPWAQWVWNCNAMKERWEVISPKCNGMEKYRPDECMSKICTAGHGGLQGNGGFSL